MSRFSEFARPALAALALFGMVVASPAQEPEVTPDDQDRSTEELARRMVERRAIEAVIWGMPAVNYDHMLQEMLNKTDGEVNQVVYWSRPVDWKNQTLTPNPDAIYLMIFYNTKDVGPIVIDVPPAEGGSFAANIVNIWQAPLEDAGPNGADQGKGGKYVILPPGFSEKPPEGYFVLQSDTYGGYALFRSNLPGRADADIAKSVAYGRRLKVYPPAQAANPPPTVFTDAIEALFDYWVPTSAAGQFDVLFRLYAPTKALFDKTWVLPDIEKVN